MSDSTPAGGGILPRLQTDFDRAAQAWHAAFPNAPQPRIVDGERSVDAQAKAYDDWQAGRRTLPAAPPGRSYHQPQADGTSHAIDIGFFDAAGNEVSTPTLFAGFASIMTTVDPLVTWGGTWAGRQRDPVHFQLPRWLSGATTDTTPTTTPLPHVTLPPVKVRVPPAQFFQGVNESSPRVKEIRIALILGIGFILTIYGINLWNGGNS